MAASIIALKCPVCGAPFTPESDRCGFCGSILVLKTDHPRIEPRLLNKAVIDQHIAEYRRTLRMEPSDETAHYGLGVAYFNLGLVEDSIRELTHAAQLMPENPNIQTQLAVVMREAAKQGDFEASNQMQRRVDLALRLDSNNIEALLLKAEILAEPVLRYDSIEYLEKAYSIDVDRVRPRLVEGLMSLADKHERLGEWSELPRMWNKLGKVDPQLAKSVMNEFLEDKKKLIPARSIRNAKAVSVGSDVLVVIVSIVATLIVGFIGLVTLIVLFPTGSWVPTVALLPWLAALIAVPIWAVKRKGKKVKSPTQVFDRENLVRGQSDFATTEAAATQVAQIKSEQRARQDAVRGLEQNAQMKRRSESRPKGKGSKYQ